MERTAIVALGLDVGQDEITSALTSVRDTTVSFFPLENLKSKQDRENVFEYIKQNADAVIMKDILWEEGTEELFCLIKRELPALPVIPLGSETISRGIFNIDSVSVERINRYFIYGGRQNIAFALSYIKAAFLDYADVSLIPEPQPIPFDGIFHPDASEVFNSLDSYLEWHKEHIANPLINPVKGKCEHKLEGRRIGLLIHRSNWISGNLAVEIELIRQFENRGICSVPVFHYGSQEPELDVKDFDTIVASYFSRNGVLDIDALINLQIFVLNKSNESGNVFEETAEKLKALNIPVFKPLISYSSGLDNWMKSAEGLAGEISWSFTVPEMQGMIEPVIIGCRDYSGKNMPIAERMNRFVSRVEKWLQLRDKPNNRKKLAVFIHNAPCSGVEATIGMGTGLDVFSSVTSLLKRMENEGWKIKNRPETGEELRTMIMNRKAYSDFRWTSVEDIIDSGGCIYRMPLEGVNGYNGFYSKLDPLCRMQMESTWGPPPGEGMVYQNDLIITGLDFGNVAILVQPKRGCYGAKCTGEVCKILQDPLCPPPHQYFASYRFAEEIFKADVVLHVGTHGSLEFLPGKTNALSGRCFPDTALGDLPNLYIYNAGVSTEAMLAKRRSYAVILDHLPPVYSGADAEAMHLAGLVGEYMEAVYIKSSQVEILEKKIREKIEPLNGVLQIVEKEESFYNGVLQLKSCIVQSVSKPRMEKLHEFGKNPSIEDVVWYIKEIFQSVEEFDLFLRNHFDNELDRHHFIMEFIQSAVCSMENGSNIAISIYPFMMDEKMKELFNRLSEDIKSICAKLERTENEMDQLMAALNGEYVPPGPSGMPDENGRNILPTGRNMYLMDADKIPTKAAYEVGCRAAEELLAKYMEDEGKLPEKIAMNMISLDISRSKGEQLSQILYLMGIRPMWDKNGKVSGIEAIPISILNRPRIDVTVRISGVLRDCYPGVAEMIDSGAIMAANLQEDETVNYVRKHTAKIVETLFAAGMTDGLERRATIRVFGDRPGTYGAGVDLALKASAWRNETDLAKTFAYFSSYAYGKSLKGDPAAREFAENVKGADASYDTTNSRRCDILASDYGASVQGGFGLMKKVMIGKEMRQYHGSGEKTGEVRIQGLKEKLTEAMEETFFNPYWKEQAQKKGYEGAAQLMNRLLNIFEWQCLTEQFEDRTIDRLVTEYINDPMMQQWFKESNPYALEEAARRFLELEQRERWHPDPDVLDKLKTSYLSIEGNMEERVGDVKGDIQAGGIEIISDSDIREWKDKLKEVDDLFEKH